MLRVARPLVLATRAPFGNLPRCSRIVVSTGLGTSGDPGRGEEVGRVPRTVDLNELYDASYRRLVVQIYAICGDLAEAEDAVHDAFVTALRKMHQLARVANPEAWV